MLLSFSANTLDQATLERTLVGRKEVVDRVEQELLEKVLLGRTYQSLLIAPRGSGKTHITKLLHYRLKNNPDLDSKILVAYMNEDERGIANYSDFIRHILQSFVKHKEGKYDILMDLIYEVSGLPISKQEKAFENILLEFIGKKGLVILVENLNVLFDKKTGMGPDGQKKLRSLMHEHNQFSLLATSQSLFYHIQDAKGSFYNFFNIRHLEKLDFKNAFEFIKVQASLEKSEALDKAVEETEFKGKVRAIYQLTGGNHRLLVIFFNFLKTNLKSELSKVFVKTMNDLKPYYEQFVNALSPQQQKVIQYLSSKHTPQMGKAISRFCFIPPTTLSKQISELVDKGIIGKNKVGKDVYYELKEALMRICFEITESADGVAKLFIDFLKVLYSEDDLQKRYLKFKFGALLQKDELKSKYEEEAKFYEKTLPITTQNNLSKIKNLILETNEELTQVIDEVFAKKDSTQNIWNRLNTYFKEGNDFCELKDYKKAIIAFNKVILLNPQDESAYYNMGLSYQKLEKYEFAMQAYAESININPKEFDVHFQMGIINAEKKKYKKAKENFISAALLNNENPITFYNLGVAFGKIKEYELSIKYFKKSIDYNSKDLEAYINLGVVYGNLNKNKLAIDSFKKGLEIEPRSVALYNDLGMHFLRIKDFNQAFFSFEKGLSIDENHWRLNGSVLQGYLMVNDLEASKNQLKKVCQLINNTTNLFSVFLEQDNLNPLLKNIRLEIAKSYFKFLLKTLKEKQLLSELWKAFPKAIFNMLINIEDYSEERLVQLNNYLQETFKPYKEMTIPLLYLDIGIRYLKQGKERAIYDFSKEERQIFQEFVLDKRAAKFN